MMMKREGSLSLNNPSQVGERSLKGISFKCGKRAAVVGQNSEQQGCTTASQTIDSTK